MLSRIKSSAHGFFPKIHHLGITSRLLLLTGQKGKKTGKRYR